MSSMAGFSYQKLDYFLRFVGFLFPHSHLPTVTIKVNLRTVQSQRDESAINTDDLIPYNRLQDYLNLARQ